MSNALSKYWKRLKSGKPGRRFLDLYDARLERRGSKWSRRKILKMLGAAALIIAGMAIGWLPGPGGFIAIIGVAMLATEIRWIARLLDKIEPVIRRMFRALRRFWRNLTPFARVGLCFGVLVIALGLAYGVHTSLK